MIYGESSIGTLDHILNRIFALTTDDKYRKMLDLHAKIISPMAKRSAVNHTDFIASCALGQEPLVAVLQGDITTAEVKKLLGILNSPKHLPYLTIRPLNGSKELAALPEMPASITPQTPTVILIKDQKILGSAPGEAELEQLLDRIISGNTSE